MMKNGMDAKMFSTADNTNPLNHDLYKWMLGCVAHKKTNDDEKHGRYFKQNNFVIDFGVDEAIREGQIPLDRATNFQNGLMFVTTPKVIIERVVYFLYGKQRTGKSQFARFFGPMAITLLKNPSNKWFDGYRNQEIMVMEDVKLNGGEDLVQYFKLWLDTYAQVVEIKGASVIFTSRFVLITSNYTLKKVLSTAGVMNDGVSYDAIVDRIDYYWQTANDDYMIKGSENYHKLMVIDRKKYADPDKDNLIVPQVETVDLQFHRYRTDFVKPPNPRYQANGH